MEGVLLAVLAVLAVAGAVWTTWSVRRRSSRRMTAGGSGPRTPSVAAAGEPDRTDDPPSEPVIELDRSERTSVDPLAPVPADEEVLAAEASDLEVLEGPVTRVVLHPGPVTRRRLAGRPDALVVVADAVALDVPGWIVEDRSRMIERTDRVRVPWSAIARFRVRAAQDGPDVYDITTNPDAPPPRGWRIRRDEIADEVTLLDHVRRVGRITIELEDSIRS